MLTSSDGLTAFRARWIARRDELRRLHALVDGAELCDALLGDLDALLSASASELLSLRQAAAESGYSPDHLGRLIREGKIPNAGRHHAPRIRRADLPRRAGVLPPAPEIGISRVQIARSVVNAHKERRDG